MSAPQYGLLENGKWYLLVFNWSWPNFSLSLNGGPFRTQSLSHIPTYIFEKVSSFRLGPKGNVTATLTDEVMIFNRPLDRSEAKAMYEAVTAWAESRAP